MVLENLRFTPKETNGDSGFAQSLARLGTVFVNDAFGTMHRACVRHWCSNTWNNQPLDSWYKRDEPTVKLIDDPERPFVAILGGAKKVSDKIGVIDSLSRRCDTIMIGGAVAYTFLKAQSSPLGIPVWKTIASFWPSAS